MTEELCGLCPLKEYCDTVSAEINNEEMELAFAGIALNDKPKNMFFRNQIGYRIDRLAGLRKRLEPFNQLYYRLFCDDGHYESILPDGTMERLCSHPELTDEQRQATKKTVAS